MKKFIAYAILAGVLFAAATAHAAEQRTLDVTCWKKETIAKAVADKKLRVIRFWEADFQGGKGIMAQLLNPKDGIITFFAIDAQWACMIAATEGGKTEQLGL